MPEGLTTQAQRMDGNALSTIVKEELSKEIAEFVAAGKRRPGLAVLLIGDDPASHIYVKNKVASCGKIGIESTLHEFPSTATAEEVLATIKKLNEDETVDGILVQLPLPKGLPTDTILNAVSPKKDVDGLHPLNAGLLLSGKRGLRPCTPFGIMVMLDRYQVPIEGMNAVVIGRSNLVGKPIALMLMERNATVTICHSRSKNLPAIVGAADILVVAAGKEEMVKGEWVKRGAVVIDVGIHRRELEGGKSKLVGDVEFQTANQRASHITPVPGGVGPMTVAMLLANTVEAYKSNHSAKQ
ncbi:MAG: bifunctional methylenetetrahydrofolate dehydrogenase/methenyltetrahydrofolate cyclohydrolase FolD [Candidatus Obscuribacterales bacterium]